MAYGAEIWTLSRQAKNMQAAAQTIATFDKDFVSMKTGNIHINQFLNICLTNMYVSVKTYNDTHWWTP